jgi:hypothetical protein
VQAQRAQPRGGNGAESLAGRRDAWSDAPDDAPLDHPRLLRRDQLAAERPQQRVRDGREADLPEPAELPRGLAQERVVLAAAQERRMVVVDGEQSARMQTVPSGRCQARARSTPAEVGTAASSSPSRKLRVASPARRAVSASE